jgi:nucleoside phosphorylase
MASELSVEIKVGDKGQDFQWNHLRDYLQTTFGGEISDPEKSEKSWNFQWIGTNSELISKYANKGIIDQEILLDRGCELIRLTKNKECLYEALPNIDLTPKAPRRDVEIKELQEKAQYVDLLLMTVTDIERRALLSKMDPWPGEEAILVGSISYNTYRFGQFGRYRAAQVESAMSSEGRDGARATLQAAIGELNPKAILLLGIAFGINPKRQHLGDVIIAESVYNYSLEKKADSQSVLRGGETHCGPILSERFRVRRDDWKLSRTENDFVKVHQGLLLSGPKLIDNKEFRDQLVSGFANREVLGGEMEGAGAYEAAERENIEIILVKGICDWADGDKNDRAQPFAAYSAVSLAHHVLCKPDAISQLKATDISYPPTPPKNNFSRLKKSRYKPIINALTRGSLVPFIGPGINPKFYINLANDFAEAAKTDLQIQSEGYPSSSEELIHRLIGIPCLECHYQLAKRPSDCPVRKRIKGASDCPLYLRQELAVSKIDLRHICEYYIGHNNLLDLYDQLYESLAEIKSNDSTHLHEFLANLPRFMLSKGYPRRNVGLPYQLIVTTNYDTILEEAFEYANQPFDVVFYVAAGDEKGKFKHQPYKKNVRLIDSPSDYQLPLRSPGDDAVDPHLIILKLFGTCDQYRQSSFVTTEPQLAFLLDNLQRNLPHSLMSVLNQSSILIMGYSPRDTDLDRVLRCLWAKKKIPNQSYLIHQALPGYLDEEIWDPRNVDLIKIPSSLDEFATQLKEGVEAKISAREEKRNVKQH